jgi:hypothetical protein
VHKDAGFVAGFPEAFAGRGAGAGCCSAIYSRVQEGRMSAAANTDTKEPCMKENMTRPWLPEKRNCMYIPYPAQAHFYLKRVEGGFNLLVALFYFHRLEGILLYFYT